jgi:DDE superfamily endonuclease
VILDGKIVAADRCHEKTVSRKGREIDLWYSGKKKDFGGNIQGLFYPGGLPMWISGVLPGTVHDLAAARENVLPVLRKYTGRMPGLADCGYEGAGHGVLTPVKKPKGLNWTLTRAPGTCCSARRDAWEKEASRCFPSGGRHSSTSPRAPAR